MVARARAKGMVVVAVVVVDKGTGLFMGREGIEGREIG